MVGGCSGRNYPSVSSPAGGKRCFGHEAERERHMRWSPHERLSALITVGPSWEDFMSALWEAQTASLFVC